MDWITEKLAIWLGPKMIARAVGYLLGSLTLFLTGMGVPPEQAQAFEQAANPVLVTVGGTVVSLALLWFSKKKKPE